MGEHKGERLKKLCKAKSISITRLAEKIGYEPNSLYNITSAKGNRNISRELAHQIVTVFPDVRITWLLGYEQYMTDEEENFAISLEQMRNAETLFNSVLALVEMCGYEVNMMSDGNSNDAFVFTESKNASNHIKISASNLHIFELDILDYVEFRMKKMFSKSYQDAQRGEHQEE